MSELMSDEELHAFGIEIVFNDLQKSGHKILGVNVDLETTPQIVTQQGECLNFIYIVTTMYPKMFELSYELKETLIQIAKENNATPFFAPVGLMNVDGEPSLPIKNGQFMVNYRGIQEIS